MSETAKYLLMQYLRDPLRREPKNVGIVVIKGGEVGARFLGDVDDGLTDGRSLRSFSYPNVYKKWVKYWRETINKSNGDLIDNLISTNGANYNAIPAGEVTDTGSDSAAMICNHLYAMLVAGNETTIGTTAESGIDPSLEALREDVTKSFRDLGILGTSSDLVPNPIWANRPVLGKRAVHEPAYIQQRDKQWVIELVSFSTTKKASAKDHAGWAAKMFDDIVARDPSHVEPIVVIRSTPADLENKLVKNSIALLEGSAKMVTWSSEADRKRFLKERDFIARLPPSGSLAFDN